MGHSLAGRFELILEAGHLQQLGQPERLLRLIWQFADAIPAKAVV